MARVYSADDGNLNSGSIITSRDRVYSDINLLFAPRPGDGDVYASRDAAAVKQAVRNLVLTNFYDRPFGPNIGSALKESLFENNTVFTRFEIEESIREVINNYEPRARINSIRVSTKAQNALDVTINFRVVNTTEAVTLELTIERLR